MLVPSLCYLQLILKLSSMCEGGPSGEPDILEFHRDPVPPVPNNTTSTAIKVAVEVKVYLISI